MNVEHINGLKHDQIRAWLKKALNGQETLPRLTPDESHYLGILRVEKSLDPAARKSLWDGARFLLRQFCDRGEGEVPYVQELLSLVSTLKQPETPGMLVGLARQFSALPNISLEVRFAVLGALVDAAPQDTAFWLEILNQDPAKNALLALAGVIAANRPYDALRMLPQMPDSERAGHAAVINLEIAWDGLLTRNRSRFVEEIQKILDQCGQSFAGPIRVWAEKKISSRPSDSNVSLSDALHGALGDEFSPKTHTPKLCLAVCS
jgi:hypothetical protein